jgi:hypothetical protein
MSRSRYYDGKTDYPLAGEEIASSPFGLLAMTAEGWNDI